jgi:HK97 family phage prohead protease
MRDDLVRRYAPLAYEMRETAGVATLEGYASTFSQPYDMGHFREEVMPGAFKRSLDSGPDVRFLVDHSGSPLARTKSGTLKLAEDSTGLHMRAELDTENPTARGIVSAINRGDLDAMSFAFRVSKGGDAWSDDYSHRSLNALNIHDGDVSVVTHPANPATSISVQRSRQVATAELVEAMTAEIRAGRVLSAANVARLTHALESLSAADSSLDEVAAAVAEAVGTQVPADPDDKGRSARNARARMALAAL